MTAGLNANTIYLYGIDVWQLLTFTAKLMNAIITNQYSLRKASVEKLLDTKPELKTKVVSASAIKAPQLLKLGLPNLDVCLGGGLDIGGISEWGMPVGQGGRAIFLSLVARLTNDRAQKPVLWILGQPGIKIFATVWMSFGVKMANILFANSFRPLTDLREVFLEPAFSFVVLDTPKSLSKEEYAFITKQAQKNSMHVCVIQNYFLNQQIGNVWAKKRVNCVMDNSVLRAFQIDILRGEKVTKLHVDLSNTTKELPQN